jgi:hypothetical protein
MMKPLLTFLSLAVTLAGCAGLAMSGAAEDRAEHDLKCPSDKLTSEDIGGGAYRVVGCGREATYVCQTGDHTTTVCQREK